MICRRFRPEDNSAVIQMLRESMDGWHGAASQAYWEWKFEQNPHGPAATWRSCSRFPPRQPFAGSFGSASASSPGRLSNIARPLGLGPGRRRRFGALTLAGTESFDPRFDSFSGRWGSALSLRRDAGYLRWRYSACPTRS